MSLANQISRDAEFSAQFGDGSGLQELVGGSSGVRQGGRFRLFVHNLRVRSNRPMLTRSPNDADF